MRIIDAHNHPDWHGHDLPRFLSNMDRYGIARCWLLSWECPRNEYETGCLPVVSSEVLGTPGPLPFSRCISYKERAPERFELGYCPDPRMPDACERLQAAHDIYGAAICGELKLRMMYDNPDAIRLFRLAGKLKMPVVVHLQYDFSEDYPGPRKDWYGGGIDAFERVLPACPDTVFLGHAPGFWIHISNDDFYRKSNYPQPSDAKVNPGGMVVELLRKYGNLCCDISAGSGFTALNRDHEFTRKFITEFKDRVLFARDYFDGKHQELLNSLGLPDDVLDMVFHGNAERLLLAEKR